MNNLTVSVFILTYNQEKFIANTLESVLQQKTNFDFQVVIGEDCSTDNTRTICENYAKKFDCKIKLLPRLFSNIGLVANYIRTINECDGKYIAICDGDDYWIDELKLQKQVDYLEINQDCYIVHSNLKIEMPDGSYKIFDHKKQSAPLKYFEDLIQNNSIYSVTAMFRNIVNKSQLPSWVLKYPYGDLPTYLWTLKNKGEIHLIDDVTAVYRYGIGVSVSLSAKSIVHSILKDAYEDHHFSKKKGVLKDYFYNFICSKMVNLNKKEQYWLGFKKFVVLLIYYPIKIKTFKLYLWSLKNINRQQ